MVGKLWDADWERGCVGMWLRSNCSRSIDAPMCLPACLVLCLPPLFRRAPGNVDMRAALAALYWRQGRESAAESEWNFACQSISAGCSKYQDQEWLATIRRWPPVMRAHLRAFLALDSGGAASF